MLKTASTASTVAVPPVVSLGIIVVPANGPFMEEAFAPPAPIAVAVEPVFNAVSAHLDLCAFLWYYNGCECFFV